jgi:hypothetical protein
MVGSVSRHFLFDAQPLSKILNSLPLHYLTLPSISLPSIFYRNLYSAASCAVPLVYGSTQLYAKDASGKITPWNPSGEFDDYRIFGYHITKFTLLVLQFLGQLYIDGSVEK